MLINSIRAVFLLSASRPLAAVRAGSGPRAAAHRSIAHRGVASAARAAALLTSEAAVPANFISNIMKRDSAEGKHAGGIVTRFPPEPNGYLHIGHAKSICLNFGIAAENQGGVCNLRFDDTNPIKEEAEYEESIKRDVRWLGFDWEDRLFYASDYFDQLYQYAVQLIQKGKAYVCSLSAQDIREYRGTLSEPGKDSPCRTRSVEENLKLFEGMRAGDQGSPSHGVQQQAVGKAASAPRAPRSNSI